MKTKYLLASMSATALTLAALSGTANAEDKLNYTLSITASSDYMFRGISLNDEKPAFQPSLELTHGIFYVGVWASNIDYLGTYAPWEVDLYAGIRPTTGPVSWDLGAYYYTYGSDDPALNSSDLDFVEFKLAASFNPTEKLTLGVVGWYTPKQGIAITETGTIEGTASYSLPQTGIFSPSISGLLGHMASDTDDYFLGEEKSYTYWNAGLNLTVEKFFIDLRYWDTNIDHGLADSRFVVSAGVSLP